MPRYRWSALSGDGQLVAGVEEAADQPSLVRAVQGRGLALFKVEADSRGAALLALLGGDLTGPRGLGALRVAELTRELSVLLAAGQTLDQALRFLIGMARDRRSREILGRVREKVRGGASLASALTGEPASFSRLYLGLVRAGEAGGTLAETLGHLADLLERQQALAARVQSAMIYPAILMLGSLGSVALLLVYVLPQFTTIFAQAGAQLPWSTRMMIGLGDGLRAYGLLLLVGLALAVTSFLLALRTEGFGTGFDRLVLRLPVIGQIIRANEAARLCRTLGSLLQGGVGLVQALGIAREVAGNRAAVLAVAEAGRGVREGRRLADRLEAARVFPPRAVHLLRLGEETGRLAELATRAAEAHEVEVGRTLDRLVALMVPLTTVTMGLLVAAIISSLLSAMLSLNDLAS